MLRGLIRLDFTGNDESGKCEKCYYFKCAQLSLQLISGCGVSA